MVTTHNLGFPRIGAGRELKLGLEQYWKGDITEEELLAVARELRVERLKHQGALDLVPVGDFSLYDHVLDHSFLLGNIPERVRGSGLDDYFRIARGRAPGDADQGVNAGEMTKWFDTNYHYIVPEFTSSTTFQLDTRRLLAEVAEAHDLGLRAKPVLIGPVTYLWLGKEKDASDKLELLPQLTKIYRELLAQLKDAGVEWVQIDEPILGTDLDDEWRRALVTTYEQLSYGGPRLLLGTYFGPLREHVGLVSSLPVHGVHIDTIRGREDLPEVLKILPQTMILSLGVVDGRNIWKTDLEAVIDLLAPLVAARGDRLWIAPSCSLLHVPVDLRQETLLDDEVKSWLAFAVQKLHEIEVLRLALTDGRTSVKDELAENRRALSSRRKSPRVHNCAVGEAVAGLRPEDGRRARPYAERRTLQDRALDLPLLPTTTIGSFPQTPEIRRARRQYKAGVLGEEAYQGLMRAEIGRAIRRQEEVGLDVLVHGEPERNDMVEYFGEQLEGYALSQHGWVQSYGSRCVKPPILFGDVSRPRAMTVKWIKYAQSLTSRPVKGMLTGPVTILNWSFVRDDQPRSESCAQLALAIRAEVLDLEAAGVQIIQIDEAALREGLPLRRGDWADYLSWAVHGFRIVSGGVKDETQVHTHMCYSEFNDIIEAIAALDADVITIETSRSELELLDVFDSFSYPNEIGPGVYDIHSPNIPTKGQIVKLMTLAAKKVPASRLWINPDCGLKTRTWAEVVPALRNMVSAAQILRRDLSQRALAPDFERAALTGRAG